MRRAKFLHQIWRLLQLMWSVIRKKPSLSKAKQMKFCPLQHSINSIYFILQNKQQDWWILVLSHPISKELRSEKKQQSRKFTIIYLNLNQSTDPIELRCEGTKNRFFVRSSIKSVIVRTIGIFDARWNRVMETVKLIIKTCCLRNLCWNSFKIHQRYY